MTQDEMVDLGKMLRAITDLQDSFHELKKANLHLATQVMSLTQQVRRLPCMIDGTGDKEADTDPDCPAMLSDMPPPHSRRDKLGSMSDEEPNSVVTRPISVHAGMVTVRGPGIMIAAVVVLLGMMAAAALVLRPMLVTLLH